MPPENVTKAGVPSVQQANCRFPNRGEWAHAILKHSEASAKDRAKALERRRAASLDPEAVKQAQVHVPGKLFLLSTHPACHASVD